jgi:hypothetical protein
MITWIASGFDPVHSGLTEIGIREIVTSAIHIAKFGITEEQWRFRAKEYPEITRRYVDICRQYPLLLDMFAGLTDFRNDLNHAGYSKNPKPHETIITSLKTFVTSAKTLIA